MLARLRHMFLLVLTVSAEDSVEYRNAGEDVELQCLVPEGTVVVLEWKQSGGYLLFYRDGKNIQRYQDKRFANRVKQQDPEMKRGNLGVVLQKVTPEDSGTYTCEVLVRTSGGERKDFARNIQLSVLEQSPQEYSPGSQPAVGENDAVNKEATTSIGRAEAEEDDNGDSKAGSAVMEGQYSDKRMTEDNAVNKEVTKSNGRADADEDDDDSTPLAVGVGVGVLALVVLVMSGIVIKKRERMKRPNPVATGSETKPLESECLA